ncbi:MAG: hypothetical protein VYC12_01005, partial [Candidatus Thermoplasmatota archaeon]|nr:hypothetical protein [Candidatus Thermoplasmatota archaeon]
KADLKTAKKEGLESASDRAKKAKSVAKSQPKSTKPTKEDSVVSGFNLDSVLSLDTDSGGPSEFIGGGVTTSESMQAQTPVSVKPVEVSQEYDEPVVQRSNVVSSQPTSAKKDHFSSTIAGSGLSNSPTKGAIPTKASKPVKRRAVKKRAAKKVQEEPINEIQESRPSIADDDFNDFSL